MPRYGKHSPFSDDSVKLLSASACFADIAVACGGLWGYTELEDFLNNETDGITNQYRKMLFGSIPTDATIERVHDLLINTAVDLRFWRDNPLWILLSTTAIDTAQYNQLLQEVRNQIHYKGILFEEEEFLCNRYLILRESNWEPGQDLKHDLYSMESLVFFTALLATAGEYNHLQLTYRYSMITMRILERLIPYTPQLYIRWPLLLKVYADRFWPINSRTLLTRTSLKSTLNLMNKVVLNELNAADKPPKQLFYKINREYLNYMYTI